MSADQNPTRRFLLVTTAATGLSFAASSRDAFGQQSLPPTPACGDHGAATLRQTEGPFFKPRSPERGDLREPGITGRQIELSGVVLTRSCQPLAGALVDLWQADDKGDYDNRGFRLRGHVFTDAQGKYLFRTIVPGAYEGRTRHFHVKVQAPNRPVLTTQFYFPGEAKNRADSLFRRELVMQVTEAGEVMSARFDVILDLA